MASPLGWRGMRERQEREAGERGWPPRSDGERHEREA